MRVTVVYLGPVADITHRERETITLRGSTLRDLLEALVERHGGGLEAALIDPPTRDIAPGMAAIVDGKRLNTGDRLEEGSEVALVMAVAGG